MSSTTITTYRRLNFTHVLILMTAINLLWRLVWWPVSQGAYTDGLLQIDLFRRGLTYWPPLYALLARLFVWIPGLDLEGSARLVSVIAGTVAVIPTGLIARRLFGERAALFAMMAYTVSPLPLRWSLQVMTDATFLALWTGSLACALAGSITIWPQHFNQPGERFALDYNRGSQFLLLSGVLGTLATLTRYQGIFLVPVIALMAWLGMKKLGSEGGAKARIPLWASLLPWLAIPLWVLRGGVGSLQVHFAQMGARAATETFVQTLIIYWYFFESFLFGLPYFITLGLFGFAIYGLARTQFATRRIRWSLVVALYLSLAILVLQSLFLAFQERYFLPIVPFACILAGHGLAVWQKRQDEKPALFWGLAGAAFLFAALFSALVAFHQGQPFIDIKKAALYLRDAPEEAEIFATEVYNERIGAAKLEYWSGRDRILYLGGEHRPGPGDYIVLSSVYTGWQRYQQLKQSLLETMQTEIVAEFASYSYPLLPDVMEEPGTHVSPAAWPLRYFRQKYETTILRVKDGAAPGAPMGAQALPQDQETVAEGGRTAAGEAPAPQVTPLPGAPVEDPMADPRWAGPEEPSEEMQLEMRAAERAAEIVERLGRQAPDEN